MENLLYTLLSLLICCIMVFVIFKLQKGKKLYNWNIRFFRLMCISLFIWVFFTALHYGIPNRDLALKIGFYRYIGITFMAPATFLHVLQQVNIKAISNKRIMLFLIMPIFISILVLFNNIQPWFVTDMQFAYPDPDRTQIISYGWGFYLHTLYSYILIVGSAILLLRILFLLPNKMRKEIHLMLAGILVMIVANIFVVSQVVPSNYDVTIVTICITMFFFYASLKVTSMANILITSREYVLKHISSIVLVLDPYERILTCNKDIESDSWHVYTPTFLEPYEEFRENWIEGKGGRISEYDENIITFTSKEQERHYTIFREKIKENGHNLGYIIEITDITRIYSNISLLHESAYYDPLTGLYNRNAYIKKLKTLLDDSYMPLLVILGDINDLKKVNDTNGHLAGDALIKRVAFILRNEIGRKDFLARIGGDEFIILIPNGNEQKAQNFMNNIAKKTKESYDETFGLPSIALGFSILEDNQKDLEETIKKADEMMYVNKRETKAKKMRYRYLGGKTKLDR